MAASGGTNYGLNDSLEYFEFALDSGDSKASGDGSSLNTDWPVFWLPKPLTNVAAVKIIECQIPFTYYVFNSSNNMFELTESSGTSTVTIPPGNYTALTLPLALQSALDLASTIPTLYTVTYSTTTMKFTIVQTAATQFTITIGHADDFATDSARNYLGFYGGPNVSSTLGILTSPYAALITGPNYVYINSNFLGASVNMYLPADCPLTGAPPTGLGASQQGGGTGPQVAKVPITVNPGGINYWADPDPQKWFDLENMPNVSTLDFFLSLGNIPGVLSLNGQSFSLKLGILQNRMVHNDVLGGGYHCDRVFQRSMPRGLNR